MRTREYRIRGVAHTVEQLFDIRVHCLKVLYILPLIIRYLLYLFKHVSLVIAHPVISVPYGFPVLTDTVDQHSRCRYKTHSHRHDDHSIAHSACRRTAHSRHADTHADTHEDRDERSQHRTAKLHALYLRIFTRRCYLNDRWFNNVDVAGAYVIFKVLILDHI